MEIKDLTRLSAPIQEATFFEIACMFSFQVFVYVQSESFALICLVYFEAVYINVYCIVIERLQFLTRANDHKLSFSNIEA